MTLQRPPRRVPVDKALGNQERTVLAELLPVVHLEYALSEIEYFADVVRSAPNADLSYETYLIGHTRWFESPAVRNCSTFCGAKPSRGAGTASWPGRPGTSVTGQPAKL